MKNLLKGFAVAVATLTTVVGITLAMTTEVKADDTLYDATAVLTKEIKIPEGIIVPNLTFDFEAKKLGTEDANGIVTTDNTQPDWKIPSIEFSKSGDPADVGVAGDKAIKSTNNLLDTIKGLTFDHAGVYLYKVTETSGSDSVITHYSEAQYIVRVYVENTSDGGVVVKGITVFKEKNDDESDNKSKVDPTPDPGDYGGSAFRFVNEFWDDTNLEIEKNVEGNSADLTKNFDFEITLNVPTVVAAPTGHKITYTVSSAPGTPIDYDGSNPIKVKLKDGEKITFANLPVGSTYTVVEKGATGYKPTAVVDGRGTNGTANDGTAGMDYTVTVGAISQLLVDAEDGTTKNKTTVTNELNDPSITGVITDNLPFILMVAVAGAGIIFLTVNKRRRAQ